MGDTTILRKVVNRRLDSYQGRIHSYDDELQMESQIAQHCMDFENALCGYIELFEMISELDLSWREDVFSCADLPSPNFAITMKALFEKWLLNEAQVIRVIRFFEKQRYEDGVRGASEYRASAEKAKQVLAEWTIPEPSSMLGFHAVDLNVEQSRALRLLLN